MLAFKNPLFFLLLFCVACSQDPVQVSNHNGEYYGKNNQRNIAKYQKFQKIREVKKVESKEVFVVKSSEEKLPEKKSEEAKSDNKQIEVVAGDTLYSLSKKHEVSLRDLITHNNLVPPYNLAVGSKLTILAPNYHEVKTGDTLYGISRAYNMKVDDLIKLNELQQPYAIKVGDRIRILKSEEKFAEKQAAKKLAEPTGPRYRLESDKKSATATEVKKPTPPTPPTAAWPDVKISSHSNHFSWPIAGEVISKFGPKSGGLYNDGINIKSREGSEVKAAEDGVVAYVGNELKGYGNLIIVKHADGWITAYAHLSGANVKRGQKITKGEKIGAVGMTGNVSSPQLYFGLRKGRDAVNPEGYLKKV